MIFSTIKFQTGGQKCETQNQFLQQQNRKKGNLALGGSGRSLFPADMCQA